MNDFNKVALFGPQGSGKGTQADKLTEFLGVPHIAPGDIFRKAIADKTELGQQVESIMKEGNLVPNEITNSLIKERLEEEDAVEGFVLDGYPRNENQAAALDSITSMTHMLLIDVPDEESVRRLSQRRVCTSCGTVYHLEFKKPLKEGVCDSCGKELIQRDDDMPEAIRKRLDIYHQETEPILARYEERGILHRVDGMGTIEEVAERLQKVFQQ